MVQKKMLLGAACALLVAQAHAASPPPPLGWEAEIRKADDDLWKANNSCDLKALADMVSDDVEFYHDTAGLTKGKDQFIALTSATLCGYPDEKNRREAVASSIRMSPLRVRGADSPVYGALITGEHTFIVRYKGEPEKRIGRGRFVHLMLLKDQKWKLARIVSYEHTDEGTKPWQQ